SVANGMQSVSYSEPRATSCYGSESGVPTSIPGQCGMRYGDPLPHQGYRLVLDFEGACFGKRTI
ncbi:hypothetical protein L9F63_027679, partial [Diploptera punctata]